MFYKSSAPQRLSGNLFVLRCFLHWDYTALTRISCEGTGVKSYLHNSETSRGLLFKVEKLYLTREVEGLCKQAHFQPLSPGISLPSDTNSAVAVSENNLECEKPPLALDPVQG